MDNINYEYTDELQGYSIIVLRKIANNITLIVIKINFH